MVGLRPDTSSWEIFGSQEGFVYVRNPFQDGADRAWARRCLREYARPPFRTNLDPECLDGWFDKARRDARVAAKLRWVTLGYHHDWDTKVYSEDNVTPMPQVSK